MNFVDEQNDVAACLDFFENFLQALFEVTAVTAACNKRTEIECVQLLVAQSFGNIIADNLLCETFNDCGLTNARLTDDDWVVLGTTRQDLHDAFHFASTTNNGVELLFASKLREVATELIENLAVALFGVVTLGGTFASGFFAAARCTFGFALWSLIARQQLNDLLTHTTEVGAQLHENLCGHSFAFANETQQNVFSADVVVAQLQSFTQ